MPMLDLGDIQLHYKDRGEGPPVLGIMGFAVDQRFWAAQVSALTANHRFITFDNRGVGKSTGAGATSLDQMADDAVRLMDHLEIDKAVVFGMSMGGAIAQRLVLDHPERVSALILAVTFARPIEYMRREEELVLQIAEVFDPITVFKANLIHLFSPRFFEMGEDAIDRMVRSVFDDPNTPPQLPLHDLMKMQIDAFGKHDVLHELPKVSCPTLVIGGRMDMMVPGFASEEIAAAIPGAELVMLDGAHGLAFELMEDFNKTVTDFLARLPAS